MSANLEPLRKALKAKSTVAVQKSLAAFIKAAPATYDPSCISDILQAVGIIQHRDIICGVLQLVEGWCGRGEHATDAFRDAERHSVIVSLLEHHAVNEAVVVQCCRLLCAICRSS